MSFSPSLWHAAPPPPSRTKEEALALASDLAQQAARDPNSFGELALRYSEDVATKEQGGSLGGAIASRLHRWPNVLEAIAVTPLGSVSAVVETIYGFHIFLHRPPPALETVTGRRIVVAYDEAPWTAKFLARRPVAKRSRQEALELAQRIYMRAREEPLAFVDLVREFSDHRDGDRDGDFGTWSSHEPTPFPREVEVLRELRVGSVAKPMDSLFGVQIIQRVGDTPRIRLAMTAVRLPFDPTRGDSEANSRAAAKEAAARIARASRSTEPLSAFQNQYCCPGVQEWWQGREAPALEQALETLEPGEIGLIPVEANQSFYVIQRRLPSPDARPPNVRFELSL